MIYVKLLKRKILISTPCPNCGGKLEEKRGKEYLRANSETVHQTKYQCAKCGKIYTAERLERE